MNIKLNIVFLAVMMLVTAACGHDRHDHHTHDEDAGHTTSSEEASTIATLTAEQIRTVGIRTGHIESKALTATIRANGILRVPNHHKGNITSVYGGVIRALHVEVGRYVRKGQVIATIAHPQFIQLQEEYLTLRSRITLAAQELQRQTTLTEGNAGAVKNLQNAEAELGALKSRQAALQKQLELLGVDAGRITEKTILSELPVVSPLSGAVSNVFANIGSYTDAASPIAEVVDNSFLHLDLQVFEKDLPLIRVGQVIHFTLTNNPVSEYDATVFSIGSSFENESKTIAVHANVTSDKTGLIDGMNITGIVSLSDATAPAVPAGAIVNADGKDYIFVVLADGNPEHHHEKKADTHTHAPSGTSGKKSPAGAVSFEKVEVIKGVSHMGYTAITPVAEVPQGAEIAVQGAFFINARLSNAGGHAH